MVFFIRFKLEKCIFYYPNSKIPSQKVVLMKCDDYVLVPPKIATFTFGDEPLNFGESASVQCTISGGDLPMDVNWKLNGNDIPYNMDVTTSRMGKRINVLMIDSVKAHHAGNYTCLAKNKAGQTNQSALLIVIGLFTQ